MRLLYKTTPSACRHIAIVSLPTVATQPSTYEGLKCLRTASAISADGVRVHVWLTRNKLSLQRRAKATVKGGKRRGGVPIRQLASPSARPATPYHV